MQIGSKSLAIDDKMINLFKQLSTYEKKICRQGEMIMVSKVLKICSLSILTCFGCSCGEQKRQQTLGWFWLLCFKYVSEKPHIWSDLVLQLYIWFGWIF